MKPTSLALAVLLAACTDAPPFTHADAASEGPLPDANAGPTIVVSFDVVSSADLPPKALDGTLPDASVTGDASPPLDLGPRTTREELERALALTSRLTPAELSARFPVPAMPASPMDPRTALGFDALQTSALSLQTTEVDALGRQGFVLSDRRSTRHFVEGYLAVYRADLPVYITADAVLHAMHAGFDDIVAEAETSRIAPALARWISDVRGRLGDARDLSPTVRADLELHLAVTASLLSRTPLGGVSPEASMLTARVVGASGAGEVTL